VSKATGFGPYRLDEEKRVLWRGDELVPLRPKALDLLVALVAARGDVVTKQSLLQQVWPDTFVEEANLSVNVSTLRRALGRQPSGTEYIETVPRRGYRFAAADRMPARPERPRLAVLPFRRLGGAEEGDWLGVAMADAVITRLGALGEIDVRPTGAVLEIGVGARDPLAAGKRLQVDFVLDGAVQLAGERQRVTVQLVPVAGGGASWAESFDEPRDDPFAVQDAVAARVAEALVSRLSPAQRERLSERGTASVEAYQAWARGRYFWSRLSSEWIVRASNCFHEAVELDPRYAAAHAGLAETHLVLGFSSLVPPRDAWASAATSARRSLELDPGCAEALAALGWVRLFQDWAWSEAEASLAAAVERRPSFALAHQWRALLLMLQGHRV
jgi:DNA-binding winged helix-turn-helix (wHTH) protein